MNGTTTHKTCGKTLAGSFKDYNIVVAMTKDYDYVMSGVSSV
jgi:hypothetical protein